MDELGDGGGGHADAAGAFLHRGGVLRRPEEEEGTISGAGGGAPEGLEPSEESLFRSMEGYFRNFLYIYIFINLST